MATARRFALLYPRFVSAGLFALAIVACANPALRGDEAAPVFTASGKGVFAFDTGAVKGQLHATDRRLGVSSLIVSGSDINLAGGVMSHYRLFSGSKRFGDGARGWPKKARLLPDGSVEVIFDTGDYPFAMKAVYRWSAPDTLDMQTVVTPKRDLPDFELFMGSYFVTKTRGFLYTQPNQFEKAAPRLMPLDTNAMIDGAYMMFPRDPQAARKICDGRWAQPPHPVRWAMPRWYAGPLGVRRHTEADLAVAVMAPPDRCFAIAGPYNKFPPDGPSSHASLYHCLYGDDLKANQPAAVGMRMIVGSKLTDKQIIERYTAFVESYPKP